MQGRRRRRGGYRCAIRDIRRSRLTQEVPYIVNPFEYLTLNVIERDTIGEVDSVSQADGAERILG